MRNMSFMLTTEQFKNQTKTVTRRNGWENLESGTHLMGCEKCQGLKKGEKINRLGEIIILTKRRERLDRMTKEPHYGQTEVIKEGFPDMTPKEFVDFYCTHNKCKPDTLVTRISFDYAKHIMPPSLKYAKSHSYLTPKIPIDQTPIINLRKMGRNEPCHCGSEKKFKKCCLTL